MGILVYQTVGSGLFCYSVGVLVFGLGWLVEGRCLCMGWTIKERLRLLLNFSPFHIWFHCDRQSLFPEKRRKTIEWWVEIVEAASVAAAKAPLWYKISHKPSNIPAQSSYDYVASYCINRTLREVRTVPTPTVKKPSPDVPSK